MERSEELAWVIITHDGDVLSWPVEEDVERELKRIVIKIIRLWGFYEICPAREYELRTLCGGMPNLIGRVLDAKVFIKDAIWVRTVDGPFLILLTELMREA